MCKIDPKQFVQLNGFIDALGQVLAANAELTPAYAGAAFLCGEVKRAASELEDAARSWSAAGDASNA